MRSTCVTFVFTTREAGRSGDGEGKRSRGGSGRQTLHLRPKGTGSPSLSTPPTFPKCPTGSGRKKRFPRTRFPPTKTRGDKQERRDPHVAGVSISPAPTFPRGSHLQMQYFHWRTGNRREAPFLREARALSINHLSPLPRTRLFLGTPRNFPNLSPKQNKDSW